MIDVKMTIMNVKERLVRKCPSSEFRSFPSAGTKGCRDCKTDNQVECSFPSWIVAQLSSKEINSYKRQIGLPDNRDASEVSHQELLQKLPVDVFEEGVRKKKEYVARQRLNEEQLKSDKRKELRGKVWSRIDKSAKATRTFATWVEITLSEFLGLAFTVGTAAGVLVTGLIGIIALSKNNWIIALCSVPLLVALAWANMQSGEEKEEPPMMVAEE